MASPDEATRRTEETRQKVRQHWERNGRVWVDMNCVSKCWGRISNWVDVSALYGDLVSNSIANDANDYHHLIGGNYPPSKVKNHLLHELIPGAGKYGPYLFYMCLLKSSANGHLGHSSAARELKTFALGKGTVAPPAISGEADPMERDGQRPEEGGGRGIGESEGGGGGGDRGVPQPSHQSSQQVIALSQSSRDGGHNSLVLPREQPLEQGLQDMSLSGKFSTLNDSMSPQQTLSTLGSPQLSWLDSDVERDRPGGQSLTPSRQQFLASSGGGGGVSHQSSEASLSSLQSHHGVFAQASEQAEGQSARGLVKEYIQCGEFQSVVNFHREKCDIAFATPDECKTTNSFISRVRKFIVASLNSRHQLSSAILVAGIDEDSCEPFPLAPDCQRLDPSRLPQLIFCRDTPDGQEVPLSQEQINQISLTFLTPRQTGQPSQPPLSPVAMVTVCPTPAACHSCIFTYRGSSPTVRGEVWRRADGHTVKVERPRELRRLHDQLAAQSNNSPSRPNVQ